MLITFEIAHSYQARDYVVRYSPAVLFNCSQSSNYTTVAYLYLLLHTILLD